MIFLPQHFEVGAHGSLLTCVTAGLGPRPSLEPTLFLYKVVSTGPWEMSPVAKPTLNIWNLLNQVLNSINIYFVYIVTVLT